MAWSNDKILAVLGRSKLLKNVVFNLLVEEELDNPEISDDRKAICKRCKFNESGVCNMCHCFIDVKVLSKTNYNIHKGIIEVTHCPKGFWEDAEIANMY